MHFESPRLRFRPLAPDDFSLFFSLDQNPNVVRFLGNGQVKTEAQSRARFEKFLADQERHGLGISFTEYKATGAFAGRTGLIFWELDGELVWEIGYTLTPDFWGQGLATEAATFWKQIGFQRLDVPFLVSLIHPDNHASIRIAEKNGMHVWKTTHINNYPVKVFRVNR